MNYVEALKKRYSVKKFDQDKKIDQNILKNILEAGKLSASSLGLQPYKVLVIQNPEVLQKLQPAFYNPSQISTCSHLLVIVTRKKIEDEYINKYFGHIADTREIPVENLQPFRKSVDYYMDLHDENEMLNWNERQGYLLLGTLMFAAALEKVDSCPMEGFKPEILSEILEINPETEKASVTLALGYRSQEDPFQSLKKVRKPDDLLFKFL